ncbi:MAG TPA: MFS transporter [Clostridiales bacterium]|nr:MFS transporter [Clostridiales bacterium]
MTHRVFFKNFTLLVLGQASSLLGNGMLRLALSMYVLEATGSAAVFAGMLSIATIPTILLSPFGGILADRANRRNIMVVLDALTGISVLGAALLFAASGSLTAITVLLVILSVLGAFETPTVQACVPQMQTGGNIAKGNAVISQVAAITNMISPMLGSLLYTVFGLEPVMYAGVICFFATALLECFIKLDHHRRDSSGGVLSVIRHDLAESFRFIGKEQPGVLKLMLLSAAISFFIAGIAIVGLPYIVRVVLGMGAEYYGGAQSAFAFSAILGSIAAGLLVGKLKVRRLSLILAAIGAVLIPAGIAFIIPISTIAQYIVNIVAFCGMQMAIGIFNIFALSLMQQKTPQHLMGKVMAYISTIVMCAQPIGQIIFGFLFDSFTGSIYLVLIFSGLIVCVIGMFAAGFFRRLEKQAFVASEGSR